MKEPQKIKLTDSPINKKVNLIPLPSLIDKYPETTKDDLYIKDKQVNINPYPTFDQIINWEKSLYEDNQQDNSEIVQ